MADTKEELKWSSKFWSIDPSYKKNAKHAALFTDYPTTTIKRAEQMGYGYTIVRLNNETFAPFEWLFVTHPK